MFGDLFTATFGIVKAYFKLFVFTAVVVSISSYVLYTRWVIGNLRSEVTILKQELSACQDERAYYEKESAFKSENIRNLTEYYEKRKDLDTREGEIILDDLTELRAKKSLKK